MKLDNKIYYNMEEEEKMSRVRLFLLLWGPSGSGKDYFVNKILREGIDIDDKTIIFEKPIQYTDRPMRTAESQYNPYVFCTNDPDDFSVDLPLWDNEINKLRNNGSLLSVTTFKVINGIYRYAVSYNKTDSDLIMASSYFQLLDIFKWRFENRKYEDINNTIIWPIYIGTTTEQRLTKLFNRELKKDEKDQNFKEIARRFIESDSLDYNNKSIVTIDELFNKQLQEMHINIDSVKPHRKYIENYYDKSSYYTLTSTILSIISCLEEQSTIETE